MLLPKIGSSEAAFIPSPIKVTITAPTLIQDKEAFRNIQDKNMQKMIVKPYWIALIDPNGKSPASGFNNATSSAIINRQSNRKLHLCSRFILGNSLLNDKSMVEQNNATV